MTATTSDQHAQDPPAATADDTPGGSQAARIGKLEKEQERQGTVLDRVLAIVEGKNGQGPGAADPAAAGGPPAPGGIEEIRQAIKDVHAEEAAAAAQAAHAAEHDRLRQPPREPEHPPRESGPSWKARLQGRMFGADR